MTYQSQLDEIARGLIRATAESDQSASPTLPDAPGLFTWNGAPAMPASGIQIGLAGMIKVNASVDPAQGGNPSRLRDGGISNPGNPAYVYNSTGASGFSDRLNQLLDALDKQQSFDPSAGAGANASVSGFAASSVAWLQAERKSASDDADSKSTLLQPVHGCVVQRHRRQPRRGDDAAAGPRAILSGVEQAHHHHRQHVRRAARGGRTVT